MNDPGMRTNLATKIPYQRHEAGKRSKRILFLGEGVCLAHVGRPAVLARWAREAGYDVHFACGSEYSKIAEQEGHRPLLLKTFRDEHWRRISQAKFFYSREHLDAYVASDRAVLKEVQPDLVVGDWRLSLSVSSKLERVPMLNLINAHWSPVHPCRMPAPRAGIWKHMPGVLRKTAFQAFLPMGFRFFAKALDDLRVRNGLQPLKDLRKLYTDGDACAYLDVPEFTPLASMPENHFYLGPVIWKPKGLPALDLSGLDGNRSLAYVTMGSTGDERLVPRILEALFASGFNAVISGTQSQTLRNRLKHISDLSGRVLLQPLLDPDHVLRHAALTVCHSGSGTVYQSLAFGVPLLCLPDNPDQGLVASEVQASRTGVNLHPEEASVATIKDILSRRFMDSALSLNARKMSNVLQACDTRSRWIRWLDAYFGVSTNHEYEMNNEKRVGDTGRAELVSA